MLHSPSRNDGQNPTYSKQYMNTGIYPELKLVHQQKVNYKIVELVIFIAVTRKESSQMDDKQN